MNDPQSESPEDQMMFFAFLGEDKRTHEGPIFKLLKDKPLIREFVSPRDRKFRPLLQFRKWADKRQRFIPSFCFIGIVSFLFWSLFPGSMQAAAGESRTTFWRCVGTGLLIATFTATLTRAIFLTQIGWPLGIVISGLSQAILLAGLSVAVYNLGHSLILLLRLSKLPALASNPGRSRVCELLLGTFLSAALLQIPAVGIVPPIGTRLLALFALLGIGAIYRILKQRSNQS